MPGSKRSNDQTRLTSFTDEGVPILVSSLFYYQLPFGNLNDSTNARPDQDALITLPSRLHAQGREGHSKELNELGLG